MTIQQAVGPKQQQAKPQQKNKQQQQSRSSRQYMRQIVARADEHGQPIKFTLKFKKFMGDLMAASYTGVTTLGKDSNAKSRIIFTVGGDEPAILEGHLVNRPYTQKQRSLAVSADDTDRRRMIEFTIRPMNQQERVAFIAKRQQKQKRDAFINARKQQVRQARQALTKRVQTGRQALTKRVQTGKLALAEGVHTGRLAVTKGRLALAEGLGRLSRSLL